MKKASKTMSALRFLSLEFEMTEFRILLKQRMTKQINDKRHLNDFQGLFHYAPAPKEERENHLIIVLFGHSS
jgi:hypothetical protein